MRLQMHKILFLLLIFSLKSVCQAQDFSSAKKTVDSFLQDWLVKKNTALVESYFARDLFTNKYLYSAGGVFFNEFKGIERESPQKAKRKTMKSLREFTSHIQGNSIQEILTADNIVFQEDTLLLSSPKEDLYTLRRIDNFDDVNAEDEEDEEDEEDKEDYFTYLKSKFPSKDYLELVVRVKYKESKTEIIDIPVYAIWARENSSWKIIEFGLEPQ